MVGVKSRLPSMTPLCSQNKFMRGQPLNVNRGLAWFVVSAGLIGCGSRSELDSAVVKPVGSSGLNGESTLKEDAGVHPSTDAGVLETSVLDSGLANDCTLSGTCKTDLLAKCGSEPKFTAIGEDSVLYALNPETLIAERLGYLGCPNAPVSMTVARDGTLWLGSSGGWLMRGSVNDLSCESAYLLPQAGVSANGIGMEVDASAVEHLFVAPSIQTSVKSLMDFDPATPTLRASIALNKSYGALELVGNGMGELFGIGSDYADWKQVTLMQLDPATANTLWQIDVSAVAPQGFCNGCDVAYWNHRLYVFNGLASRGGQAGVWRYSIANQELNYLGTLPFVPVGVDAPPCAEY